MEKIFFKNSRGDKLCGILSDPEPGKGKPAAILCHGFTTSKESTKCARLESILNQNEISTFRFDFYGHGESEGKLEDITVSEAADDILNAARFLKRKGYKKMGLEGSSFGGAASIIAASKTKGLSALALVSPVSDYLEKILGQQDRYPVKEWKEKGFITYYRTRKNLRIKYSFFEDVSKIDWSGAARKITIPTLIVHGDKDESVPVEESIKTSGLIRNCRLEIIKGADHAYSKPEYFERVIDLVSGFIIENL